MQYKEEYIKNDLKYRNGTLFLNGFSLTDIVEEYGTPLYVYSARRIRENFTKYTDAFSFADSVICYAVKANYNGTILKILAALGAGADVVSGGELFMARRAGIPAEKIVFAGVGKTVDEIRYAVSEGVRMINIESSQELDAVECVANEEQKTANIAFRINPDIDPKTHPKIATGLKESKFGIPEDRAVELYRKAALMAYINIRGVHLHIGSQITEPKPFEMAAESAANFLRRLENEIGMKLENVDIGGGLGISYEEQVPPTPLEIADILREYFVSTGHTLILEPGRSIVGNAGYLLTKINYIKKDTERNFVVVDAGFNDLIRPAMYGAYHHILPLNEAGETLRADVAGPICETGDIIASDREVKGAVKGNILAVCDAGAYGFAMSSNYNSRLKAAEVLVDEKGPEIIRRRENYEDLIKTEV